MCRPVDEGKLPTWDEVQRAGGPLGLRRKGSVNKHLRRGLAEAGIVYREEKARRDEHDVMVGTCASIFMQGSPVQRRTGYTFLSVEPLLEKGVKSFDVWLYKPKSKSAIFVECKSSVALPRPEVKSVYQAIDEVERARGYLASIIDEEFSHVEYVLCVPIAQDQRVATDLGAMEKDGSIGPEAPRVLLWRVDLFNGQNLQFFHTVPGRGSTLENRHRDPDLSKTLRDQVKLSGAQLGERAYPSSHSVKKSLAVVSDIIQKSEVLGRERNLLPVQEVREFFGSRANLGHYAAAQLEPRFTAAFLKDGGDAKALVPLSGGDPETLRIVPSGKRTATILAHYEAQLDQALILRLARQRALKAVFGRPELTRGTLDTWADSGQGSAPSSESGPKTT